jgi:hypothetical protein
LHLGAQSWVIRSDETLKSQAIQIHLDSSVPDTVGLEAQVPHQDNARESTFPATCATAPETHASVLDLVPMLGISHSLKTVSECSAHNGRRCGRPWERADSAAFIGQTTTSSHALQACARVWTTATAVSLGQTNHASQAPLRSHPSQAAGTDSFIRPPPNVTTRRPSPVAHRLSSSALLNGV